MSFLLTSLVLLFVLVFVVSFFRKNKGQKEETTQEIPTDCCGAHEVCEKDSLLSQSHEILYYNDEELDEFTNKKDNYTVQEINMFEEVLYTLKEEEVAGWLRSLQLRNIQLPEILRDAALLIVSEKRGNEKSHLFKQPLEQ